MFFGTTAVDTTGADFITVYPFIKSSFFIMLCRESFAYQSRRKNSLLGKSRHHYLRSSGKYRKDNVQQTTVSILPFTLLLTPKISDI